jgi:hypothetical protein
LRLELLSGFSGSLAAGTSGAGRRSLLLCRLALAIAGIRAGGFLELVQGRAHALGDLGKFVRSKKHEEEDHEYGDISEFHFTTPKTKVDLEPSSKTASLYHPALVSKASARDTPLQCGFLADFSIP